MNHWKRIGLLLCAGVAIMNVGSDYTGKTHTEGFSENDAIATVLHTLDDEPDGHQYTQYPNKSGETKTVITRIGGKAGTTAAVDYTTSVKVRDGAYIVTLEKDSNVTIGSQEAVSYWEYEVVPHAGVKLVGSSDNDNLMALIK